MFSRKCKKYINIQYKFDESMLILINCEKYDKLSDILEKIIFVGKFCFWEIWESKWISMKWWNFLWNVKNMMGCQIFLKIVGFYLKTCIYKNVKKMIVRNFRSILYFCW